MYIQSTQVTKPQHGVRHSHKVKPLREFSTQRNPQELKDGAKRLNQSSATTTRRSSSTLQLNFNQKSGDQTSTVNKKGPPGPKVRLSRLESKNTHNEDTPEETRYESGCCSFEKNKRKRKVSISESVISSLDVFYLTNSSQVAKDEDDFWRYERENSIIDRFFGQKDSKRLNDSTRCRSKNRTKSILKITTGKIRKAGKNSESTCSQNVLNRMIRSRKVVFKEMVKIKTIGTKRSTMVVGWLKE